MARYNSNVIRLANNSLIDTRGLYQVSQQTGTILAPLWHQSGTTLIPVWHQSGSTLITLWHYLGTALTLPWHCSGTTLAPHYSDISMKLLGIHSSKNLALFLHHSGTIWHLPGTTDS